MIHVEAAQDRAWSPRVRLRWGLEAGELTPEEARHLALVLLRAADKAEERARWLADACATLDLDAEVSRA
jgi:hypothetical protein